MKNPYSKTFVSSKHDEVVAGSKKFTRPGSAEPIVASNGDINASSVKDLLQGISDLIALSSAGKIEKHEDQMNQAEKKEALASAYNAGASSEEFIAIGETMAAEVKETLGREGIARKFLQFRQLNNGDVLKVRLRKRDTLSWITTSNPQVVTSVARQPFAIPDMFSLTCSATMEAMEIAQDTGDLLDDRYSDCLEQILCGEDRVFLRLANSAATSLNSPFSFSEFTPTVCSTMRTEVLRHGGIPVTSALISFDIWNDIVAQPEFTAWYSEIAKHELVLEGNLGSLMGMQLVTDGYRIPTLRVLPDNTVFMFGSPDVLGVVGQWGDLSVKPIDKANDSQARVGWFMNSIEAMTIGNARAVVRGTRVI